MNDDVRSAEQNLNRLRKEHAALLSAYVHATKPEEQYAFQRLLQKNELTCTEIQQKINQNYSKENKMVVPHPPIIRNVWHAFLVGGLICSAGQVVILLMQMQYAMDFRSASAIASITIVVVTAILTGLGIYDEIGRFGGAGSMVPISGFSNSIVSAALEWKSSGMIYGIGAKIFTIAGPVILYGTMASVFLGLVYYVLG